MATSASGSSTDIESSTTLRHVTIFTTPAGATSKRFGTLAALSPALRHWGLIFQDPDDFAAGDGLCIELDVNDGRIFPKRTRWSHRKQEDNGKGKFRYVNTDRFTFWHDDGIEWCARNLCNEQMKGTYNVLDRNCQVLVNLLLTRIVEGGPFNLGQTLGHLFIRKSTQERLFDISEFDHGTGEKLLPSKSQEEPEWSRRNDILAEPGVMASSEETSNTASPNIRPALIDLSRADRPDGPLNLDELRHVAKFWAQEPHHYVNQTSNKVILRSPSDPFPQITAHIKALAAPSDLEARLRAMGDERARSQGESQVTPLARENARKAAAYFQGYYENHVSMLRQFATRSAAMKTYLDPNVSQDVRDDKVRRLVALNSQVLREARVQSMQEHRERLARGEGLLGINRAKDNQTGAMASRSDCEMRPTEECSECSELNTMCFACFADANYHREDLDESPGQDGIQQDIGSHDM